MPPICADCRTANRDGAKFCKGCGHRLRLVVPANSTEARPDTEENTEEDWPATQRVPMRHELERVEDSPPSRELSASLPPGGWQSKGPNSSAASPQTVQTGSRESGSRRIASWGLIAAMLVVVGGWYALHSRTVNEPAKVLDRMPVVQPTPSPPVSESIASAPAPDAAEHLPPPPQAEPQLAPPPQDAPIKPAATPAKARKPAPVRIAAPAVPPPPSPVAAPEPAPAPAAPPSPQSACEGLNFFARARCMAALCAKADYRAHAQCEAVRRQQQIEEEKRNPSLLN